MKKAEEFEKWMKAGEVLGAEHDRTTAWAAWSTAWDAAINEAADTFWYHPATRKRIPFNAAQDIVETIKVLAN